MNRQSAPVVHFLWWLAIVAFLLAACAGHASRPALDLPPQPTFVPTVVSSTEITVTVGSQMAACPGNSRAKCYQVRREGSSEWNVFPAPIQGFDFWPGSEYVIVVREDKVANPPPGSPDVLWTIVKGLYKINSPETPAAAPE
jgi:hypothetical protein